MDDDHFPRHKRQIFSRLLEILSLVLTQPLDGDWRYRSVVACLLGVEKQVGVRPWCRVHGAHAQYVLPIELTPYAQLNWDHRVTQQALQ